MQSWESCGSAMMFRENFFIHWSTFLIMGGGSGILLFLNFISNHFPPKKTEVEYSEYY